MSFTEHLLRVRSEDGLRLDGVAIVPEGEFLPTGVVWVHGHMAAFYDPPYVEVARAMAAKGFATIVGNTRGHDFGAVVNDRNKGPVVAGGGWERFHESPYDLAAWITAAIRLGLEDVVLVGHGHGARKAVYYQVGRDDTRVRGVVVASPRLDYPTVDRDRLAQSEEMVSRGHGRDLLPWPPVGAGTSAQTFVDWEMTYQHVLCEHNGRRSTLSQLNEPILAFYGSLEDSAVRIGQNLDTLEKNALASAAVSAAVIPGAGYFYDLREELVADLLAEWIDSLE